METGRDVLDQDSAEEWQSYIDCDVVAMVVVVGRPIAWVNKAIPGAIRSVDVQEWIRFQVASGKPFSKLSLSEYRQTDSYRKLAEATLQHAAASPAARMALYRELFPDDDDFKAMLGLSRRLKWVRRWLPAILVMAAIMTACWLAVRRWGSTWMRP